MGRGYKHHGDLDWLQMEANRILRKEWKAEDLPVFAQEMASILFRVKEPPVDVGTVTLPGQDPIEVDLPTFDFPFEIPDPPVVDPGTDPIDGCTSSTQSKVDRTAVPCKVLNLLASEPEGAVGVQTYNCELYPFGVLADIYPQWDVDDPDNPNSSIVLNEIALQLQIDTDEIIPSGTWTIASRITISQIVTQFCTLSGIVQPPTTSISLVKAGNFIQVPVWL